MALINKCLDDGWNRRHSLPSAEDTSVLGADSVGRLLHTLNDSPVKEAGQYEQMLRSMAGELAVVRAGTSEVQW